MIANQQKMYYADIIGTTPVYVYDEDGNIKTYTDTEGNVIYLETGEYETQYSEPTEFWGCISSTLASAAFKPFGVDKSSNMAVISVPKETIKLAEGSIIWKQDQVRYKDADKTIPDGSSANYVVKGVADCSLNNIQTADLYLLERLNTVAEYGENTN